MKKQFAVFGLGSLRDYDDDEIEKIYLKEHDERKKLIQPVELT